MKMAFNQLEKKDYMKTSLRAYFLQNGFNYGNYQALAMQMYFIPPFARCTRTTMTNSRKH